MLGSPEVGDPGRMGQDSQDSPTPSRRVFVSYARVDKARVDVLVKALEARGCSVWIDGRLTGGREFAQEIEAELRAADAVVVVWTETSITSGWVRDEADLARDLGRLVPVRLDNVKPPLGFGQYHTLNLAHWDGTPNAADIDHLVHAIAGTGGVGPTPVPKGGASGAPNRRTLILAGAGLAAPVVGGAAWWFLKGPGSGPAVSAHTVAVLPFVNLSSDQGQEYFAAGLSEEVRAALARIDSLQVAARTSSAAVANSKDDSVAIGRKLGVAYLLEGSVRRSGATLRVNAQLAEASTGFEKWSQTYDRPMTYVFAIQTEIAQLVAGALQVKVMGTPALSATGGTTNPAAYDSYLRGRRALTALTGGEAVYRQALADFDTAVAADPKFAAAYALRARTLIAIAGQFAKAPDIPGLTADAVASAEKAVALAPNMAVAQSVLALTRLYGNLDVRGAKAPFERSRDLGQGDADVLARYGLYAARTGQVAAALAALQRAAVLDPLNPGVQSSLGAAFYVARRYPDAIASDRRALALSPQMNLAHADIGNCLLQLGRLGEARTEYLAEPSEMMRLTGLAIVAHKLGDALAAKTAYRSLVEHLGDSALYQQAQVLAARGDKAGALAGLARAFGARDSGLILLDTDPFLDALRGDRRFIDLRARLGFS